MEHKKETQGLEKEIWSKVKKGISTKPAKVSNHESDDEEILESLEPKAA